ncbi:MAG: hypothetical protein ABI876_03235 [Bacteroidota bacterium]
MAIYELTETDLVPVPETQFGAQGILERGDLQRLLRTKIEIISPDTLIISEEFGGWDGSKRRIDLLGIDKNANLVVIELKRTEDGGHMDLQAIRYAAMVSTMTFEEAVNVFGGFLRRMGRDGEPAELILEFLDWDEPDEYGFALDVRIVLAAADFDKEITTAVIWLNDHGVDVRCVRLRPHDLNGRLLLDVQQLIPLPEAEQYQIQVQAKNREERSSQVRSFDLTKYDVIIDGNAKWERLPKRTVILRVVAHLCEKGVTPESITEIATQLGIKRVLFAAADGKLDSDSFVRAVTNQRQSEDRRFDPRRFHCSNEYLIVSGDKTYALTNQWGGDMSNILGALIKAFPGTGIEFRVSE